MAKSPDFSRIINAKHTSYVFQVSFIPLSSQFHLNYSNFLRSCNKIILQFVEELNTPSCSKSKSWCLSSLSTRVVERRFAITQAMKCCVFENEVITIRNEISSLHIRHRMGWGVFIAYHLKKCGFLKQVEIACVAKRLCGSAKCDKVPAVGWRCHYIFAHCINQLFTSVVISERRIRMHKLLTDASSPRSSTWPSCTLPISGVSRLSSRIPKAR